MAVSYWAKYWVSIMCVHPSVVLLAIHFQLHFWNINPFLLLCIVAHCFKVLAWKSRARLEGRNTEGNFYLHQLCSVFFVIPFFSMSQLNCESCRYGMQFRSPETMKIPCSMKFSLWAWSHIFLSAPISYVLCNVLIS